MLSTLKEFFDFASPHERRQFYFSILFGVLKALFSALRIPAIAIVIHAIIHDAVTWKTALASFVMMGVSILGMILVQRVISMQQTEAGYRTCANKRIEIAEHMRYVPMGYFSDTSLGRITSVATNTLENLEGVASRVVMLVTQGVLTGTIITIMIIAMDIRIGLLLIAGLAIFALLNIALQKRSVAGAEHKHESDIVLVETVMDYVRGIAEVKNYNLADSTLTRLAETVHRKSAADTRLELDVIPLVALQGVWLKLLGVGMSLVSIWFFLHGSLSLFLTIMMLISAYIVYESLDPVSSYSSLLRSVKLAVIQVNDVLDIDVLPENENPYRLDSPRNISIELRDVSFSYDSASTPVVQGVSFSIKPGERVAFVGPSGSGKTTLARLIARFWDVDSGSVLLDGRDVREWDFDVLMENFSFVFQRVFLFEDTIENNIRFGAQNATRDDVIRVAKAAQCHDFIMSLPDGYNTVVGEGGGRLSGGEKQRISIARAMLKNAPIVILDEATANIDPENERELVTAIEALTKGKTVVMIAHRLPTVRNADRIFVLDEGRLVDSGTHDELSQRDGVYKRFLDVRTNAQAWKL